MLRIHFTAHDLARVRMAATAGSIAETVFALDIFVRHNGVEFGGWRREVRRRLGSRVGAVEQLARSHPAISALLRLSSQAAGSTNGDSRPRDPGCRRVVSTLIQFRYAAVMPYWKRVRGLLEAERDGRGRIAITKGVEHLLGTLHPRVRWEPPVLVVPGERRADVHLGGAGLLLRPSLFLFDRPGVLVDADRGGEPPALAFPVALPAMVLSALCGDPEPNEQALSALVGHTRAAALQALTDACTTSELARRLNISSAGASQHATVLREAGLITTCRNRNTVLHAVTSLGMALLQNAEASQVAPSTRCS